MAFDLVSFGRDFTLGTREVYTPSTQKSVWVAGGDGLAIQKTLETGEKAIRTQGIKIGTEDLYGGLFPDVEIDPDGVATLREILPQTTGQKVGTLARPWGEGHFALLYGSGAQLTGVEKTSNRGAAGGYCPLDSEGLVPYANLPPYFPNVIVVDAEYNVRDIDGIIFCASDSAPFSLLLDAAVSSANQVHVIKNTGSNIVTIDPDGDDTIEEETTLEVPMKGDCVVIACDGEAWWVIGRAGSL